MTETTEFQAVVAIDKCRPISVTTKINIQMLENIHELVCEVCESKIMHGIKVWGLSEAWKDQIRLVTDKARN
jgi:hypothetical protein